MVIAVIEQLEQRRLLSAGSIDTSFGKAGQVVGHATVAANGIAFPQISSLAQLSDGKIVAAGYSVDNNYLFVTRLNHDGTIDTSFGTLGTTKISLAGFRLEGAVVAIDSANRILVGTTALDSMDDGRFAVARLTANGAMDKSFSGDGMATAHFAEPSARVTAMAVEPDGRVVLTGWTSDNNIGPQTDRMAIARFTTAGLLDTQFSVDGLQTIIPSGYGDNSYAVAILKNGDVLISGEYGGNLAAFRLTSAGQLDKTFGDNGIALAGFGGYVSSNVMLTESNGSILLAADVGGIGPPNNLGQKTPAIGLAEFNGSGKLVSSFGTDGQETVPEDFWGAQALGLTPGGEIRLIESDREIRLNSHGSQDSHFGTVDLETAQRADNEFIEVGAVLFRTDGTMINAVNDDIGLEGGNLDIPIIRTLDVNDKLPITHELRLSTAISDVAVDSNGKLVVGSDAQGDYLVYRYNADGSFDSSFGTNGRAFVTPPSYANGGPTILPLGDGREILTSAGYEPTAGDSIAILVSRLQNNGTLDPNLEVSEFSDTEQGQATLLPGGFVTASFFSIDSLDNYTILIAPSGKSIDANLPANEAAMSIYSQFSVPIGTTGDYVVEGEYLLPQTPDEPQQPPPQPVLAEFDAAGNLVTKFGKAGVLNGQFDLQFAQFDGKLIYKSAGGLKRLMPNGSPDPSFGNSGLAAAGYTNFTADSVGHIIAWKINKNGDVQIARFSANGHADKSFGDNGVVILHPSVKGAVNLMVTPTNNLVITSVGQAGESATWWATRIHGS